MRKRKQLMMDELVQVCGYFGGYSIVNNYYNCDHPQQGEKEFDDELGREIGKCLYTSCPVAWNVKGDLMRVFDEKTLKTINSETR